jgi:hypothetical protein
MAFMLEVYYRPPADLHKEKALRTQLASLGGRLSYREAPETGEGGVCLTCEFEDRRGAVDAAQTLRQQGEHVEGPVDYGP